jgi:hypothetical protein
MPSAKEPSRTRKLAASGALVASGAAIAAMAFGGFHFIEWSLIALGGGLSAAGIGLSRRSVSVQVLSRAAAWLVFAPMLAATLARVLGGRLPEIEVLGLSLGTGAALLLARPMLHTGEAQAAFDPVRYRRWLLGASTASAAVGIMSAMIALAILPGEPRAALGIGALSAATLASAVATTRMRGWGVLLGGVTSLVALAFAAALRDVAGVALALAAVPGLMLMVPVLAAARKEQSPGEGATVRVSSLGEEARVRVALADLEASEASDLEDRPPALRA